MVDHIHSRVLFASDVVTIFDVCCRAKESACGPKEESFEPSMVIPRRGVFVKHVGSDQLVGDANCTMFFNPGETYRVSHPIAGGDDCLSFHFSPSVLREAFAEYDPSAVCEAPRFLHTHGPLDSSAYLHTQRLRIALNAEPADPMWADESALALLATALRASFVIRGQRPRSTRPATDRAHRAWAENARVVLARHLGDRLRLADLAKEVHCSPFHLARVFRRHAGVPIHRYLSRLRLRHALERLLAGERNLTLLALDLGFSSHAHFSDGFRREFGCPPSDLRRLPPRKMSKILKASQTATS